MFSPDGKIQKRSKPNPDGSPYPIELPVLRSDTGVETPCGVCPKIPAGMPKIPANAVEFEDWFWDLYDWYRESRTTGFPQDLAPVMKSLAAEFHDHERLVERSQQLGLIAALAKKGKP